MQNACNIFCTVRTINEGPWLQSKASAIKMLLMVWSQLQYQQTKKGGLLQCFTFVFFSLHPNCACLQHFKRSIRTSQKTKLHSSGHIGIVTGDTSFSFLKLRVAFVPHMMLLCCTIPTHSSWAIRRSLSKVMALTTLTQLHLCVHPLSHSFHPPFPLYSSRPHDTFLWLKGPTPTFPLPALPHPHNSKFPFAARSAECCCLLCTQKFAEAVSCPQTSAPWSGAGGEAETGPVCMLLNAALPECVMCGFCVSAFICVCVWVCRIIQIGALYPLWVLYQQHLGNKTYICVIVHRACSHTDRCTSFQLSWCTNCLLVKWVQETDQKD